MPSLFLDSLHLTARARHILELAHQPRGIAVERAQEFVL
jgi:hypothetical protein